MPNTKAYYTVDTALSGLRLFQKEAYWPYPPFLSWISIARRVTLSGTILKLKLLISLANMAVHLMLLTASPLKSSWTLYHDEVTSSEKAIKLLSKQRRISKATGYNETVSSYYFIIHILVIHTHTFSVCIL